MNDFNLNNGRGALNDDIDLILQQIDILFDTNPREVFGNESFGTTYDKYLYQLIFFHYKFLEFKRFINSFKSREIKFISHY